MFGKKYVHVGASLKSYPGTYSHCLGTKCEHCLTTVALLLFGLNGFYTTCNMPVTSNSSYLNIFTGKCIATSCNKHWCDGTAIGFGDDILYVGFSSTFRDLTAANPSVDVNFYRNQSGTWHRTASETFTNNEKKRVHLMGAFVSGESSSRHRRMAVEKSQWEFVTFKAKISRTSNKVFYQVGRIRQVKASIRSCNRMTE